MPTRPLSLAVVIALLAAATPPPTALGAEVSPAVAGIKPIEDVETPKTAPTDLPEEWDFPDELRWTPAFAGIELAEATLTKPRPLRLHAARVRLDRPGVRVVTDGDNGDAPEETFGAKTTTYLRTTGCQLAANGAPFWPVVEQEGLPHNVVGLVVSDGGVVSPAETDPPRPALVIRGRGAAARASVERPPLRVEGIETAVGGFGVVLDGGKVVRDGSLALHPRTGAGSAASGHVLLLLAVDGRQRGYSEGATTAEVGELLRRLGAEQGINLDGGGTTTLAMAGADGEPRLLNRPIHEGKPGSERVSASHIGVFAPLLPGKESP